MRQRHTQGERLGAAVEMFSFCGYDGTSMRDLAERGGITTAALYYHFDSKADILGEVVRPLLEESARVLDEAEEAPDADRVLACEVNQP